MRKLLLISIRGYQWGLRPFLGSNCRFYPSCSCYAHEAILRYGAWNGLRMAIQRLSRCHPWNDGGYDPVEPACKCDATHSPHATS
jgi:putative membrane protein insertion efficiency factor